MATANVSRPTSRSVEDVLGIALRELEGDIRRAATIKLFGRITIELNFQDGTYQDCKSIVERRTR